MIFVEYFLFDVIFVVVFAHFGALCQFYLKLKLDLIHFFFELIKTSLKYQKVDLKLARLCYIWHILEFFQNEFEMTEYIT